MYQCTINNFKEAQEAARQAIIDLQTAAEELRDEIQEMIDSCETLTETVEL